MPRERGRDAVAYALTLAGVLLVTLVLAPFRDQLNPTSASLALLLAILFGATAFGSGPALVGAVAGVLCLNYFFLPPVGTFTIADPANWIALVTFLVTAVTVGQLSARARRRAEEAEASQQEVTRLYRELQDAFERASEAEALRRSERLKSALLDAVTHDLRTPLTSIKASATTLLQSEAAQPEPLDPELRRELLQVIDEEADRLNRFIEHLVDLARIDAGALDMHLQWRSLEDIVGSALTRASQLTRAHIVDVDLPPELPSLRVDARAIAEVVYSLVENAAKYSPAGTRIRVTARRHEDEALDVMVEDEGPGIPVEIREKVFTKFYRAGDATAANADAGAAGAPARPDGLGMGLAIARGIIDAHGGRVWIEDGANGRGTRVICRIPIGDEDAPAARPPVEGDARATPRA
jgi:two-component system sensor histidine kinase KdpD